MEFINNAGTVIGLLVASISILTLVGGGSWWMSNIYTEVHGIRSELQRMNAANERETEAIWAKMDSTSRRVDEHGERIIRLESKQ